VSDYNTIRHGSSDYFTNPEQHSAITKMIDIYQLTTHFTTDNAIVTGTWTRDTDLDVAYQRGACIGSPMSESSGVFTFPSVGKYIINACCLAYAIGNVSGTATNYSYLYTQTTKDNFATSAGSGHHIASNGLRGVEHEGHIQSGNFFTSFHVENTSTDKVRFKWDNSRNSTSNYLYGSGTGPFSVIYFRKIG
tara:strand:+ start:1410 stop:1985 length:576 start_codon:yes stop_codon:yes gene_type:complete